MLEIENFRSINKILLKNRNYNVLTGDNEVLLVDICEALDMYYNKKRKSKVDKELNDNNLMIYNYFSKEKEKISSRCVICVGGENLEEELQLGSKTLLNSVFNKLLKIILVTEPLLITANSLLKELNLTEAVSELNKNISQYSDVKFEISIKELTASDIIKKMEIHPVYQNEYLYMKSMSEFEKLKLQTGIIEQSVDVDGKDKIYIFVFPENKIALKDMPKLRNFLLELAKENKVIVATFSKYLFDFSTLDNINIYINSKLTNSFSEDEIINEIYENYPVLKSKSEINALLSFVLKNYLSDVLLGNTITNKFFCELDNVFIENYEFIFLLLYYLKKIRLSYKLNLNYDPTSPFSNYIEEKLLT